MKLHHDRLPEKLDQIVGLVGEEFGDLELGIMVMIESLLCQHHLVRLSKPHVPVDFFHLGLSEQADLSSIVLTTLTEDAVHTQGL
jgi:hypothetical protein